MSSTARLSPVIPRGRPYAGSSCHTSLCHIKATVTRARRSLHNGLRWALAIFQRNGLYPSPGGLLLRREQQPPLPDVLSRRGRRDTSFSFRDYFCKHFWITTSGNFSNPALLCCVMEMGVDRILFSVDYPFVSNMLASEWIPTIPLGSEDKAKILCGNADRLLRL